MEKVDASGMTGSKCSQVSATSCINAIAAMGVNHAYYLKIGIIALVGNKKKLSKLKHLLIILSPSGDGEGVTAKQSGVGVGRRGW